METKIGLHSEDLNNFKNKLTQNWFEKDNAQYSLKHKYMKKESIPNRNKTKLIANIRRDYDMNFIKDLMNQGIKTYKISGKHFIHKEYQKILENLNLAYSESNEVPSIIFDFKGPDTLVTKVENILNKKTFMQKQIVKISFDDSRKKYESDNIIWIDKKITNMIDIGDIIEISDSNLVLKVIGIEKNKRNLTHKYDKLLNIMEEKPHSKFENNTRVNEKKKYIDILRRNLKKTDNYNDLRKYTSLPNESESKFPFPTNIDNDKREDYVHNKSNLDEDSEIKIVHPKSSPYLLVNSAIENKNEKEIKNSNQHFSNFKNNIIKNAKRKEDDKEEYKIIYDEEECNIFNFNEEGLISDIIINNEDGNENHKIENEENIELKKLHPIEEENSKEFELEEFFNEFKFNEDEEFFEGKYFDNLYEEKLKTKQEKIDLIFQNIVKRQISNKQSPDQLQHFSNVSVVDDENFSNITYNKERDKFDILEADKLRYFERKERIKSSSSLEKISNRNNIILCEVVEEGMVVVNSSLSIKNKDINSGKDISIISAKDIIDINQCLFLGINIFSFIINNRENVSEIKDILGEEQINNVKIFASLETQESLINFDSILKEVDGIVLNHGFKFYNFQYKDLYLIELYIIEKCKKYNKPLILQTNSIKAINFNKPAIFKISILDFAVKAGIDGMIIKDDLCELQEYVNTIKVCRKVILEIEKMEDTIYKYHDQSSYFSINKNSCLSSKESVILSLLDNSVKVSHEINADLIILFTDEINYAKIISKYRPACVIACPTKSVILSRFLRLFRGVIPFYYENITKIEDIIENLINFFLEKHIVDGDIKIITVHAFINPRNKLYKDNKPINNGICVFNHSQQK